MFCARFIVANRDGGESIPGPVQPEYPELQHVCALCLHNRLKRSSRMRCGIFCMPRLNAKLQTN